MECVGLCSAVQFSENTATDFLSKIDLNPEERVELKIREDITIRPVQVSLQSTDVADEEQLFFLTEETIKTEEKVRLQTNKRDKTHATRRQQKSKRPSEKQP